MLDINLGAGRFHNHMVTITNWLPIFRCHDQHNIQEIVIAIAEIVVELIGHGLHRHQSYHQQQNQQKTKDSFHKLRPFLVTSFQNQRIFSA